MTPPRSSTLRAPPHEAWVDAWGGETQKTIQSNRDFNRVLRTQWGGTQTQIGIYWLLANRWFKRDKYETVREIPFGFREAIEIPTEF